MASSRFDRSAVLGAGTMGAQIAAHFANAGVPVLLLDLTADAARDGLKRARGAQARPVLHARRADAHHAPAASTPTSRKLADVDWIMEAVVEQLDIKRALLERVERSAAPARSSRRTRPAFRSRHSPKAAATTSARTGSARISSTRRATCGCVEIIPTADTDPAVVERVSQFCDHRLGKGVVVAKDTPNFIGNHLALYGVMLTLKALESGSTRSKRSTRSPGRRSAGRKARRSGRWTSPASTSWRTWRRTSASKLPAVRRTKMIEKGMVGEKSGQGFYKRVKTRTAARS